ncbi:Hypothetical predicted protein [Paramuricea clavata]|uniref:Uncharacterized protein n=1 Tax=Paramuricea clavata TaxID=317549 RepID=A0A6S7G4C0_PARCT|nr:Hypothetical predicted protein [Paramuricea clavata]
MDDFGKFSEPSLPSQKEFYSSLTDEDITDEDYEHAKKIDLEYNGSCEFPSARELEELRKSEEPVEEEKKVEEKRELQIFSIPATTEGIVNFARERITQKASKGNCISLGNNSQKNSRSFLNFLQVSLGNNSQKNSRSFLNFLQKMTEVNPESVPVTEPGKVKDPRRVEAGKKLGAMSQKYKKAKKERLEKNLGAEVREECMMDGGWISVERLCMLFGLGIGLGSLYLTWRRDEKSSVKQDEIIYENNNDVEKDPLKEPFDERFD